MSGAGKVLLYTMLLFVTGGLALPILMIHESRREKREMQKGIEEELKRMNKNNKEYKVVKCKRK